jgi:hypothetical protein
VSEPTPDLFEVKTCTKCGQGKTPDEFVSRRGYCKVCRNAYQRERYRSDPVVREWHRQQRERYREKNRAYSAEYYRNNRAKHIAYVTEYQKRNPADPERRRELDRRRYIARKQNGETCSIEGCGRAQKGKTLGLCDGHLRRYRATGVVGGELRQRHTVPPDAVCSIADCGEPHEARGLCKRHYRAERHRLNPEEGRTFVRVRRARKRQLPTEPYKLADILARDGVDCVLCGKVLNLAVKSPHPMSATIEHLECLSWPDSAGDVLNNVGASHRHCNLRRNINPHPAAALKRAELLAATRLDSPA